MDKLKTGAERLGIKLGERELTLFQAYYEELVDWNRRINLTSITGYEEVQVSHFLDALTVVLACQPDSVNGRVIDVGTGAGIPGLPLKIVFPQIQLVLLEATGKKANFLRHVIGKPGLSDVVVVAGRAEEVAHQQQYREQFDVALSRGVAPLATLVELTLPFCRPGGLVIAHKKGEISEELSRAVYAIDALGGRVKVVVPVDMPEFTDKRCLVVIEKANPTPPRYPRRPGMPAKRPLGGK
ncbi:MAG: 16S rRNA (guanine(527)-N(7))-methyltransferase RsmG [Dehalococcoidia bacterium]|nr:16S rRNA (guanine(527)-N(7))-methyltransferase RsmG [Dehalococcoidia bacterium]